MRSVGGALFKDGKLLVAKRIGSRKVWPNLWEIPGGRLESGENDEQAIMREFLEETELKVKPLKKYTTIFYDYAGEHCQEAHYIITSESFEVKIDPNEHSEFRWVYLKESECLPMAAEMRTSVRLAFAYFAECD